MEHDLCKISGISAYVENLTRLKSRYILYFSGTVGFSLRREGCYAEDGQNV